MVRKSVRITTLTVIFIFGTLSFAGAQAGPPKFNLKVAHTFVAGALAPTWAAADGEYFQKYNLNVEFVRIGAIAGEAAGDV